MNRCVMIGNVADDPRLVDTSSGIKACNFTLAVDRRVRATVRRRGEADFFAVVVWRDQGEACYKYLRKGSQVAVAGAFQTRFYLDEFKEKRTVVELIADEVKFLMRLDSGAPPAERDPPKAREPEEKVEIGGPVPPPMMDDEQEGGVDE